MMGEGHRKGGKVNTLVGKLMGDARFTSAILDFPGKPKVGEVKEESSGRTNNDLSILFACLACFICLFCLF